MISLLALICNKKAPNKLMKGASGCFYKIILKTQFQIGLRMDYHRYQIQAKF